MAISSIGKNASTTTTGVCRPTNATTKPSVAARLYAGATEATPMTVVEKRPSAPDLRPLSRGSAAAAPMALASVVADMSLLSYAVAGSPRPPVQSRLQRLSQICEVLASVSVRRRGGHLAFRRYVSYSQPLAEPSGPAGGERCRG